jgi:arginase
VEYASRNARPRVVWRGICVNRDFREMRRICVLSAPSNLGLKPPPSGGEPGVREMPASLLTRDLLTRLRAVDAGLVTPPRYSPEFDLRTSMRNAAAIRNYTVQLADRIGGLLDQSWFPLVLGGDCSILLGSALALRRRGRFGLLFIDGHTDLLTPETSATGGVAGMDLAMATGSGPDALTAIDHLKPYVQSEDVVLFGFRQPQEDTASPALPEEPMHSFPLSMLRKLGSAKATEQALSHFAGNKFWVHVDADVLDPQWMPAVDSPDPGGMNPEEFLTILKAAFTARNCVGMEFTIYDPTLDPTGQYASLLVDLLCGMVAAPAR